MLRGCVIDPVDEQLAKAAGGLLGASGSRDAVDAIVVAMTLRLRGVVVTSDPGDLHKLADSVPHGNRLAVIVI